MASWTYQPPETGWLTLRIANGSAGNPGQGVRARLTYMATRDLGFVTRLTTGAPVLTLGGRYAVPVDGPPDVRASVESSPDLSTWTLEEVMGVPGTFETWPGAEPRFFRFRAVP